MQHRLPPLLPWVETKRGLGRGEDGTSWRNRLEREDCDRRKKTIERIEKELGSPSNGRCWETWFKEYAQYGM